MDRAIIPEGWTYTPSSHSNPFPWRRDGVRVLREFGSSSGRPFVVERLSGTLLHGQKHPRRFATPEAAMAAADKAWPLVAPSTLDGLSPAIRAVIEAAQKLDRESLDDVTVHPCDSSDDHVRRNGLYGERRALSDALAAAGLTLRGDR